LVPEGRAGAVMEELRRAVIAAGHPRPVVMRTHAAEGAGPVTRLAG
jgi:galactokinase